MKNNLDHLALILDGNKRWAKKNKVSEIQGYSKGFENIKNLINYTILSKISNLTLFALSSENFNRASVNIIYELIYENFSKTFEELITHNDVKIRIFGSRENLPKKIINIFEDLEKQSIHNNGLKLNIAFNYGFKNEIKNILKNIVKNISSINLENENEINSLFNLGNTSDPDLLIRTGGYQRLSNFIMYNLTYTELFFTKTLWPDFSEDELKNIVNEYTQIKRKYGL